MQRKSNIDLLRIISAFAVIVIHIVSAAAISTTVSVEPNLLHGAKLIHILMNWSVPVFFMITGYCLSLKQTCTYDYCLRRVANYVCVLFTVGFFYAFLEEVFNVRKINLEVIGSALHNVIIGHLWDHMWYVYAIIGIYLVMPVIHRFASGNVKDLKILTAILFVFTIFLDTFESVFPVGFSIPMGGYLFYVCFGCLIAKCTVTKLQMTISSFLGVGSILWMVLGVHNSSFGYRHLAICLIAVCIFICFSKLDMKETKGIRLLSACTWGIYLLHPLFINVVIKVIKVNMVSSYPYLKMALWTVLIFALSFASTYVLRKIPLVKKLF